MSALQREASQLLATMPEQKLLALIPYMKFLQLEKENNKWQDFNTTQYVGITNNLFGSEKKVDEYTKDGKKSSSDIDRKREAFQAIIEMRNNSPFPHDFDYEKAREEAMIEKYGSFN